MSESVLRELNRREVSIDSIPPKSLVMVYAPWCPACKMAAPEFLRAGEFIERFKGLTARTMNVDVKPTLPVRSVPAFYASDSRGKLHLMDRTQPRDANSLTSHLIKTLRAERPAVSGGGKNARDESLVQNARETLGALGREFASYLPSIDLRGMLWGRERPISKSARMQGSSSPTKAEKRRDYERVSEASDAAMSRAVEIVSKLEALGVPASEIVRRHPEIKPILQRMGHMPLTPVATPKEDLIGRLVEQDRKKRESAKKRARPKSPPAPFRESPDKDEPADEAGMSVLEILERRKQELQTGSKNTQAILTSLRHLDPRKRDAPKPKQAPRAVTPKSILRKLASLR
jgi:thiol-disulfide isomerase/thioredoxin